MTYHTAVILARGLNKQARISAEHARELEAEASEAERTAAMLRARATAAAKLADEQADAAWAAWNRVDKLAAKEESAA